VPVQVPIPLTLSYDEARENYRPAKIRCLFIGESRPAGGTFFFNENSNLYYATKEAFELASGSRFDCKVFKELGCWLYDVCDVPVNNLGRSERRECIRQGIPGLIDFLHDNNPEFVFVVKKTDLGEIVYPLLKNLGYIDGQTSRLLPFPLYKGRAQYISEMTDMLNRTFFTE